MPSGSLSLSRATARKAQSKWVASRRYPAKSEAWQPLLNELQAQDRASRYFAVYGLLKPGVTFEEARAEMQVFAARFEKEFPKENKNLGFTLTPFRDWSTRDVRSSLLVLLAAVGFVLLIACAAFANLLLAKAAARRKELAVRAALGAGRWRLVRQILSESLLLAVVSAVLGWLIAVWARIGLLKISARTYADLQLKDHLQLDWRVLVFTLSVTMVTAALFGLFARLERITAGGWGVPERGATRHGRSKDATRA
jgi:hypothetical protein